jgi:flagellar assembly protein FliH
MRSSSKTPPAKVLKGVDVEPYTLAVAPEEQTPAPPPTPASWDGRDRRRQPVAEPWDGRERRSGREVEVAREESFRDGYEAGRNDTEGSLGPVREQLQGALAALRQAAVLLDAQRAEAMTVAEDEVAALAFSVAEAVLQRELQLAVAPGQEAVARALALLPDEVDVVVRMHPDDAGCLDDPSDDSRRVVIVPDPDIERGGCVADAGACRIDTQVSTALERVRRVLCDGQVGT